MPVQTVPGTAVAPASIGATTLNAEPVMAIGRAHAQVGQAIGSFAPVIQQFGIRKQQAINEAQAVDVQVRMQKGFDEFQSEMAQEPDETKWTEMWDKKSANLQQSLFAGPEKITPGVKRNLENNFKAWSQGRASAVKGQADIRAVQRSKAKFETAANYYYENQNFEEGDKVVDSMVNAGLLFKEQAGTMKENLRAAGEFQFVKRAINVDPIVALEELEDQTEGGRWRSFTHLNEDTRLALTKQARIEVSNKRSETVQGLQSRMQAGEVLTNKELDSLVDQKLLLPTQKKWIQDNQTRTTRQAGLPVDFAKALRDIDAYDPSQDPTKEKFAQLVADRSYFPTDMSQELEKRMNSRLDPASTANGDKEVLQYIDALLDGGFFGDVGKNASTAVRNPGKPRNPTEYQRAFETNVEMRQSLRQFLLENPKATPVQQREFISSKLRTVNTTNASLPVMNAISSKAQALQKPVQAGKYKIIKVGE